MERLAQLLGIILSMRQGPAASKHSMGEPGRAGRTLVPPEGSQGGLERRGVHSRIHSVIHRG